MSGSADVATDIEKLAAIERRLEEQSDGSIKITLESPVHLSEGSVRTTIVVGVARVRHIRAAGRATGNGEVGINETADELVEPKDAHQEIASNGDWQAVRMAVEQQLGKFLGTGHVS